MRKTEFPPVVNVIIACVVTFIVYLLFRYGLVWSLDNTMTFMAENVMPSNPEVARAFGLIIQMFPSIAWLIMEVIENEKLEKYIGWAALGATLLDIGTNIGYGAAHGEIAASLKSVGDGISSGISIDNALLNVLSLVLLLTVWIGVAWVEEAIMLLIGVAIDRAGMAWAGFTGGSVPRWMAWGKTMRNAGGTGMRGGMGGDSGSRERRQGIGE